MFGQPGEDTGEMLLEARPCCPLQAHFCSKGGGAVRALVPCCAEYRIRALWHGAGGETGGAHCFLCPVAGGEGRHDARGCSGLPHPGTKHISSCVAAELQGVGVERCFALMQLAGAAGRGCRFLVAGRVDAEQAFMTLADVAVPPQLQRMVCWARPLFRVGFF